MKISSPSLCRSTTLPAGLLTLIIAAVGCGSDDETPPPTNPPPVMDASTPDQSTPDVQTPPPVMDAGGIACGMLTCTGRIVGGQFGVPCCVRMTSCGLNFGQGCIDQSDSGGTPMPPADAGPLYPDPSCGTLPVDFMGTSFTLSGCCLTSGTCGYYSPQNQAFGCASLDQLRAFGLGVPADAATKACSIDAGGTPPDSSVPPDTTTPPDTGNPGDGEAGSDGAVDTATPDAGNPETGSPDGSPSDGASEGGPPEGGASPDVGSG